MLGASSFGTDEASQVTVSLIYSCSHPGPCSSAPTQTPSIDVLGLPVCVAGACGAGSLALGCNEALQIAVLVLALLVLRLAVVARLLCFLVQEAAPSRSSKRLRSKYGSRDRLTRANWLKLGGCGGFALLLDVFIYGEPTGRSSSYT